MRTKEVVVFKKFFERCNHFTLEDLPSDVQPTDRIMFNVVDDGYISDNNSIPEGGYLKIIRDVPMTEEDLEEERKHFKALKEASKQKRYKKYLELKAEFE